MIKETGRQADRLVREKLKLSKLKSRTRYLVHFIQMEILCVLLLEKQYQEEQMFIGATTSRTSYETLTTH